MLDGQFAKAKINYRLILTMNGLPIIKNFRFADLDRDNGKFSIWLWCYGLGTAPTALYNPLRPLQAACRSLL